MSLFRYFRPERFDSPEQQEVVFTPPIHFNDPFEMTPFIQPITSRHYIKGLWAELEPRLPLPPNVRTRVERRAFSQKAKKEILKSMRLDAPTIAPWLQERLPQHMSLNWGVLSFSGNNNNLLMWAHYCSSHTGFVVEYDETNTDFEKLGRLREVNYSDSRPIYDVTKKFDAAAYLTKSSHWKYEAEFRIFRELKNCRLQKKEGKDLYFAPLLSVSIRAIYLGVRADAELLNKAKALQKKFHFDLYRAKLHQNEFSIHFERVET